MCKQCELNSVYEFTNKRKLCSRCFVRYFQKKFLYVNRKFGMIRKEDVVGYESGTQGCTPKNIHKNIFTKGKDFRSVVLEDVLEMFAEKLMIKLVGIPTTSPTPKVTKIAVASTIDLEANDIVHEIINGNLKKLNNIKPVDGKVIKPLYLFLDKEVLLYAKLRKLKFEKSKEKKDKIGKFVDELEEKHPEVKRAVVKGYLKLYG